MRKYILPVIISLCLLSGVVHAGQTVELSISPSVGYNFGETDYVMDILTYIQDENGDLLEDDDGNPLLYQLKSQLEYPLDVAMGGVTFRLAPTVDPSLWSVEAGIYTSLNNPGGVMKDSDWDGISGYYDLTKWSYTESSVDTMKLFRFDIQATRRILSPGKLRVALLAGFRYQKIEQKLFGVEGWQIDFDTTSMTFDEPVSFNLYQNQNVLYYEIELMMPQIGLLLTADLSPKLNAGLKTVLAPVWFDDVDDHVLRDKLSTADGNGIGFIGALNARYDLPASGQFFKPFLDFFVEYMTLSASGDQVQEWYGDDPISEADDTGTSIGGIPHDITSTQYNIGVRLGLTF